MIKIKGQEFYSGIISPDLSLVLPDDIMEDKTVATDNARINPLKSSFDIYYVVKKKDEDYRDKRKFLEDLFYSREPLEIEDLVENIIYSNMVIDGLKDWQFFPNGFSVKISFKQAILTIRAEVGLKNPSGKSIRNIKYNEKPFKSLSVSSSFIPDVSLKTLTELNLKPSENGFFNLKCLDIGIDNLKNGISENIISTFGNVKLKFNILKDGTMDILDKNGEYLVAGQKILSNVELLANMIPGVNYSMRLLPLTDKAINQYFDILKIGKDWELVVNNIIEGVEKIVD